MISQGKDRKMQIKDYKCKCGSSEFCEEKVYKQGFMDGYERGYKDAINRREPLIHEPRKEDKDA